MSIPASAVIEIYTKLEKLGIHIWIDGGWAVDALLQEQTREHQDLDIAVQKKDLIKLKDFFLSRGYVDRERDENKKWNFVLANDDLGFEVEVHSFDFDGDGKVMREEYWDGYSPDSLTGIGNINNCAVRCVSLDQLIKTHDRNKRTLKESDEKDILALSERFNVVFPI